MGHDTLRGQMIPPTEAGLRSIDAAVRQALAESHHALLRFLTRRLGSREEAEEVLSTLPGVWERCVTPESEAGGVRNSQLLRLSISQYGEEQRASARETHTGKKRDKS